MSEAMCDSAETRATTGYSPALAVNRIDRRHRQHRLLLRPSTHMHPCSPTSNSPHKTAIGSGEGGTAGKHKPNRTDHKIINRYTPLSRRTKIQRYLAGSHTPLQVCRTTPTKRPQWSHTTHRHPTCSGNARLAAASLTDIQAPPNGGDSGHWTDLVGHTASTRWEHLHPSGL
ncbi:Hypothetical predicted protein [Pelobates cultripes]|uniref:Uncharacterized protein n=1 Tax=Pelobates cultripes TaxID=61616 RepID=A0AAD1W333_PELCU|nr:Hypothetical predicted protein [Pelobates cultripes]